MSSNFLTRLREKLAKSKRKSSPKRRRQLFAEQLEDRKLLATLVFVPATGELRYSAGAGNNNAVISFAAGKYSVTETGESLAASGFTDASADPGLQVDTTAFPVNFIRVFSSAGDDSYTIDSMEAGDGLQVQDSDTVGIDTVIINGVVSGSGTVPQISITSETLQLNGTLATTTNVTLSGPNAATPMAVSLSGTSQITSTGALTVSGSIDGSGAGGQGLTANVGSGTLKGSIGSTIPVGNLQIGAPALTATQLIFGTTAAPTTITSSGTVSLNASTKIEVTGNIDSVGQLQINSGNGTGSIKVSNSTSVSLTTDDAAVNIFGAVTSATVADLTVDAGTSGVSLTGSIAGLGDINFSGDTAILITGIVTSESIVLAGGMLTTANLTSTVGDLAVTGNIDFGNAGGAATVSSPTSLVFNGNVDGSGGTLVFKTATSLEITGSLTNLPTVNIDNLHPTQFATVKLGSVNVGGIRIEGTTNTLSGNVVATTDDVTIIGNVVLGVNASLQSGQGAGDNVLITGNVNGDGVLPRDLEILAGLGTAQMVGGGDIGNSTPLRSARIGGGVVSLDTVAVTSGDLILEGGAVSATGALSGTGNAIFRPSAPAGLLEVYNLATAPVSANMTVNNTTITNLQSGFSSVQFGSSTATKTTLFGDAFQATAIDLSGIGVAVQFIGQTVEIRERIQQGTIGVTLIADTAINFEENGIAVGTGDLTIQKLSAGAGTLTVGGARNISNQPAFPWGALELLVDGNGGDVNFLNQVARIGSVHVLGVTNKVFFNHATALDTFNGIDIDSDLELRGGLFVDNGDIDVSGSVTMTGATNFFVTPGHNVTISGNIDGGGNAIIIREKTNTGVIGNVLIGGNITNVSSLSIPKKAASLSVRDITSSGQIVIGADAVTLNGTLTANNGLLYIQGGSVTLAGNTSLINNSGTTNLFTRIDGTVNGSFSLAVNAGTGQAVFADVIGGGVNKPTSMSVLSSGLANISKAITVIGSFSWKTGDLVNAGADVLKILAAVNAGSITLEGDSVTGNQALLTSTGAIIVIQNGAP